MSDCEQQEVTQANQVWSTFDKETRQEFVNQFRRIMKEIIDEHFRISTSSTLESAGHDLREAVESKSSHHQQREPTHAIRAA